MISGTLPPYKCGVGDYTYQLAKHLSYSGLEVDILTSCGASEFDGCNVYGNVESWNRLKTLGEILNIYKRKNYDIVHIQFPTAAYGKRIIACMVVPMLKSMGVKVVVTIHEYTGGSFRYKAELWPSLLCADKIIIVEPKFKNDIKKLPIPSSKINFINIGANVSRSGNNLKVLEAIRDRVLGEKRDYRIVSTFGFISPGKLTIEILWALRYLKGIDKLKTKLLIVGDLQENDTYQKEVLQYIKDNLKISENLAKRILLKSNKYEPFVVKNVSILSVLDSSDITIKNIDKYLSESNDVSFQYLYWFVMAKEGDYKKVLSLVYKYRDNIHVLCNFLEKRISKEIFLFEEILNGNLSKENYITYAEKNNFPYYILQKTLKLFQILTLEELYAKLFLYRKLKHGNCVEFIMKGCK